MHFELICQSPHLTFYRRPDKPEEEQGVQGDKSLGVFLMKRFVFFALAFAASVLLFDESEGREVVLYVDSGPTSATLPLWRLGGPKSRVMLRMAATAICKVQSTLVRSSSILMTRSSTRPWISGRSLHCIYWLPGKTLADVRGRLELKWVFDDHGQAWTENDGHFLSDRFDLGWNRPESIEEYAGGVIGLFSFSWWALDDDAEPLSTDEDEYNEVDQADIDALRERVFRSQTYLSGQVRYRKTNTSAWQYFAIKVRIAPYTRELLAWSWRTRSRLPDG